MEIFFIFFFLSLFDFSVSIITMRLVTMWSVVFTVALQYWIVGASPQSNYAERGVDIEYQGNGIPQEATLDGIVTKLDDLTHVIRTNKSVVVVVNRLKRRAIVFNAKTLLFFLSAGHRPV